MFSSAKGALHVKDAFIREGHTFSTKYVPTIGMLLSTEDASVSVSLR